MKRLVSLVAVARGLAWTAYAAAQDPAARASAVQLFDEGQVLMDQGKLSEACPKLAASMKLDPQLGALLHLADCYERNGQLASAWGGFRQAEEMARLRGDQRQAIAHDYALRLEPRLSRLTITITEPAANPELSVRLDGSLIAAGAWGTARPIDAGEHMLEASAPGFEPWSTKLSIVGERQLARIEVPRLRPLTAPTSATSSSDAAAPARERSSVLRTVGWVGIGTGAAGLALGTVFFVQRQNLLDERAAVCPSLHDCTPEEGERIESLTSDARQADTLATVGFVAGGVLVAGGITALVIGMKTHRAEQAWLAPTPMRGGWLVAGGTKW